MRYFHGEERINPRHAPFATAPATIRKDKINENTPFPIQTERLKVHFPRIFMIFEKQNEPY